MTKRILFAAVFCSFCFAVNAQTDVHCHMIPSSYLGAVKDHKMEMDEGFPIPAWSVEDHIRFMEQAGIATSVLTMPAPHPFFGDAEESAVVCRRFNEEAAELKKSYPGKFLFCAALPLPDVSKAVEEARYALETLGADGVKLATNCYGQYLGDPELEPLMDYLNSREAVIIIHPHKPYAVNDGLIKSVPLASYEYLAETTRTVLNMMAHNVLARYPALKVVVPHCGSFLPNALPRFKALLPVMTAQGYMQPVDVEANMAGLYFDLAGAATDDVIRALLTITDPSHILYGSDYPYVAAPALAAAKKSLLWASPSRISLQTTQQNYLKTPYKMKALNSLVLAVASVFLFFSTPCDAQVTINIRYNGEDGNARKYVEEMESSGIADRIRAIEGCIRYDYFYPADDPEALLLIDEWEDQEALNRYHNSPMMKEAADLREKYKLTNRQIKMYQPVKR